MKIDITLETQSNDRLLVRTHPDNPEYIEITDEAGPSWDPDVTLVVHKKDIDQLIVALQMLYNS